MKYVSHVYLTFRKYIKTDAHFLLLLAAVFIILRIPSLIEPLWYGDEGTYLVIGDALKSGHVLYRDIWDHKPPFLYFVYALANSDLYYVKLLSLIVGVASLYPFFKLAKGLLVSRRAYWIALAVYTIYFALPILEGNIANAENFMLLTTTSGVYLFFVFLKTRKLINLFFSGVLLSISAMFKIVGIFDVAALIFLLLFINLQVIPRRIQDITLKRSAIFKNLKLRFGIIVPFLLFFSIIPLVVFAYFVFHQTGEIYIRSIFSDNIGYVGVGNDFLFPMGRLVLKLALLVIALIVLVIYRKKIGFTGFFIISWVIFSIFNAYFSQRPYTHYLLVLLPSVSLYIGYIFTKEWNTVAKFLLLILIWFVVMSGFDLIKRNTYYYINYLAFLTNQISLDEYQSFFDASTPRYYQWSEFIKSHTTPQDNIFFYGDSGQVYHLAGKLPPSEFIVAYHISNSAQNIETTRKAIERKAPKYLIDAKRDQVFQQLRIGYELKYTINGADFYEREF